MKHLRGPITGLILLALLILPALACNLPQTAVAPGTPEAGAGETVLPLAGAETPAASETPAEPTPTLVPDKLLLLALPGSDLAQATALQPVLEALAGEAGLRFETRTELNTTDLGADVRFVFVAPPDPGVANLANANPQAQFVVWGMPGISAEGNLSVIGGGGPRPDQQAFAAGYLAAVISADWRVGVISRPETAAGKAARNGFNNGVIFYCGLCRPAYPPFVQYPVFADLSGGADVQAQVAALVAQAVKTVYVAPDADNALIYEALAGKEIQIVGAEPPPAALSAQWVASIRSDEISAVKLAFERLLAGESGFSLELPLAVTDRNPALFSAGRQRVVDEILADLLSGYIDTGIDPASGEIRP